MRSQAKSGLTQTQLAEELSITFQAVSKWETGKALPDIDSLPALSRVFGVSIDFLVTGKEFEGKHSSGQHWAVRYVNELVAPVILSPNIERQLIASIQGRDRDENFIKDCILTAYESYVHADDLIVRQAQVSEMISKLRGVIYNQSLPPVMRTINSMVRSLCSRTGNRDKEEIRSLKRVINKCLDLYCGSTATEDVRLKMLDIMDEKYVLPSQSLRHCKYMLNEKVREREEFLRRTWEEAEWKYKINKGFFETDGWPETVSQHLLNANSAAKESDPLGLRVNMYKATDQVIRLMVGALPDETKPALSDNEELKDYSDQIYGWLGRNIGKYDNEQVKEISSYANMQASDHHIAVTDREMESFQYLLNRLQRKYISMLRKSRKSE